MKFEAARRARRIVSAIEPDVGFPCGSMIEKQNTAAADLTDGVIGVVVGVFAPGGSAILKLDDRRWQRGIVARRQTHILPSEVLYNSGTAQSKSDTGIRLDREGGRRLLEVDRIHFNIRGNGDAVISSIPG
jgi:hypothetical protein